MKKLLYLIIALSILTTGCKKKDDESTQPAATIVTTPTLSLDDNLIGIWYNSSYDTDAYLTFGSNGRYTVSGNPWSGNWNSTEGEWWVVHDFINSYANMFTYNPLQYYITDDTLYFLKTDGSPYKDYTKQQ